MTQRIAKIITLLPWLAGVSRNVVRTIQPKFSVGVVGVVVRNSGEMLIVEHIFHPHFPWGLPGSWIGSNEQPGAALERELREELGIKVEIIRLLTLEINSYRKNHFDVSYLCRPVSEITHLNNELLSYRWTAFSDLPSLLPFHAAAVRSAQESVMNEVLAP